MSNLIKIYKKHIKNSKPKAIVIQASILLSNLTYAVKQALGVTTAKVHMHTKTIKKLYDKRPANEFDSLLNILPHLTKFPEFIYKNKPGREGRFLFVRKEENSFFICSILPDVEMAVDGKNERVNLVVTAFRNDGDYLKDCSLLWSWKGGTPSS
jgi:hypothetical protein